MKTVDPLFSVYTNCTIVCQQVSNYPTRCNISLVIKVSYLLLLLSTGFLDNHRLLRLEDGAGASESGHLHVLPVPVVA